MGNKSVNKIKIVPPPSYATEICGENNQIILKNDLKETKIEKYEGIFIKINGNNNRIILHSGLVAKDINISLLNDNCLIEIFSSPWFCNVNIVCVNGNGQQVTIGKNTSFAPFSRVQITVDDSNKVSIGDDCMFSNSIYIWGTDGHAMIDAKTKKVINKQKHPLKIGNHCWIGESCKITKHAVIPDNCIVGIASVVTKVFTKTNCVIAGNPGKVIHSKRKVDWVRYSIYEYINKYKD